MPKLLQINSTVNSGSAGRIVEQIGEMAMDAGWESYVGYGRNINNSKSHVIKIGNQFDIAIHGIKSMLFDMHGLGSLSATKKFLKKINKIRPDIIHLHGIHGYYLNYKLLFNYLALKKTPVIWTMHDFWSVTGHCSYFSDIKCQKWRIQCFDCPKYKNYPKSLFFDRSKENYELKKILFTEQQKMIIVSVSHWMGKLMRQSFLKDFPHKVILNGVDITKFSPVLIGSIREKLNIGKKFMLLGVATSWGPRKGWDDYLTLACLLPDEYQLVMIGLNEKQLKNLPKNVIGISRTESVTELAQFYSAADVVLSLSSQETFGLTTIEGFACGTPGIVYNCTASPELITSETGFVVEKGNMNELITAIDKIKAIGKAKFSQKCRERAEKFYDKNIRFKEYIDLYNSMINHEISY